MRRVVVEESFNITGRGTAATFQGAVDELPLGRVLRLRLERPDGSALEATATVEFLLRSSPQPAERVALLIVGVFRDDVPPGSVLVIME